MFAAVRFVQPRAFDVAFVQRHVPLMDRRRQLLVLGAALVEPFRQRLLLGDRSLQPGGGFRELVRRGRPLRLEGRLELSPTLVVAGALGVAFLKELRCALKFRATLFELLRQLLPLGRGRREA